MLHRRGNRTAQVADFDDQTGTQDVQQLKHGGGVHLMMGLSSHVLVKSENQLILCTICVSCVLLFLGRPSWSGDKGAQETSQIDVWEHRQSASRF
jgi:hypothetical protein